MAMVSNLYLPFIFHIYTAHGTTKCNHQENNVYWVIVGLFDVQTVMWYRVPSSATAQLKGA